MNVRRVHTSPARVARRGASVLAVAALLGATAACGGSGDAGPSSSSSSPSASASGSATASSTASPLTASDIGSRLTAAFEKAGTLRYTQRTVTSGQALTGKGEVDLTGDAPALSFTADIADQTVQVRAVDNVFYLKSAGVVADGKWLKVDPTSSSGVGALLQQLGATSDPTKVLSALGDASSITAKGTVEVDGTATTRYDVALPSTALGKVLGFPESLTKELPDTIGYRIFVDSEDRLRREQSSFTVRGTKASSDIVFGDFGASVSVTAPPADQTTTTSSVPGLTG